jgi:DNA-binding transcriptional ArsR family regulator
MSNLSANESNIDLLRFFKALADETRLKMAALLASQPRSGEQLAELLNIKAATVSHHLSKLADAGLVSSASEGHKKFYTLRLDAVRATAKQLQAKDPGFLLPADRRYHSILPKPCSLRRVRPQGAEGLF